MQDYFLEDANASGEAYGLQNPALAVTPDVFTTITAEQAREAVDRMMEDIVAGLTQPRPAVEGEGVKRIPSRGPDEAVLEFAGGDLLESLGVMNDQFLEWGWSDGFPLVPPTEEAVEGMLRGTSIRPKRAFMAGMLHCRAATLNPGARTRNPPADY